MGEDRWIKTSKIFSNPENTKEWGEQNLKLNRKSDRVLDSIQIAPLATAPASRDHISDQPIIINNNNYLPSI